jgi:phage terminase small subunit
VANWEEIRREWETTKITLKSLADKHGVKIGTLKSRKSREGWSRDPTTKDATKSEKVATPVKKDATTKSKVKKEIEALVESDELTEKQRLFCLYYVKSFNATQAAINAGYSPDSARQIGSENLSKPYIRDEIKRLKQQMTGELFVEALDVLRKYVEIAFADITDYVTFGQKEVPVIGMFGPIEDDEGNPVTQMVNYVEFKDSNMVDGTIISEVKQGKEGVSIKLADKMKALEKLSLYFDLFPDDFKRKLEEEKLKMKREEMERKYKKEDEGDKPIEIIIKRKGDDG